MPRLSFPTLLAALGLALVVGVLVARQLPMVTAQSLQGAWRLVDSDPRIAALRLDEGRMRGVTRLGGTVVFVPEGSGGLVLLLVHASRVVALEHWTFGRGSAMTATNLLTGRRARLGTAKLGRDTYATLAVIADVRRRYATVNDVPVSVPRACMACDVALEDVRKADRTLLNAQYALAQMVFSRLALCRDTGGCDNVPADLEATFGGSAGRPPLEALFEAQEQRNARVEALRACQTLVPTQCDGGLYVYTIEAEMLPERDGFAPGTVNIINRAEYARLVALRLDGATLPATEIILPGRGESRVQVGYRCSGSGVARIVLTAQDAAPTPRVSAANRRAETVAAFMCSP